jgi:hypothetical protein
MKNAIVLKRELVGIEISEERRRTERKDPA